MPIRVVKISLAVHLDALIYVFGIDGGLYAGS